MNWFSRLFLVSLLLPFVFTANCGPGIEGEQGWNPTTRLTGRVLHLDGAPASGVAVRLFSASYGSGCGGGPTLNYRDAVTDAGGNFVFSTEEFFNSTEAELYPSLTGYEGEPSKYDLVLEQGNSYGPYNFTLHRLVPVSGRLAMNDGVTVPPSLKINISRQGASDRYVMSSVSTGDYSVKLKEAFQYSITPEPHANFSFDPATRNLFPLPDSVSGQDFTVTRLFYSISGTVTYQWSYAPAPGRTVVAAGTQGSATAVTDYYGYYDIRGLTPGTYTVYVQASNPSPPSQTVPITGSDVTGVGFTVP